MINDSMVLVHYKQIDMANKKYLFFIDTYEDNRTKTAELTEAKQTIGVQAAQIADLVQTNANSEYNQTVLRSKITEAEGKTYDWEKKYNKEKRNGNLFKIGAGAGFVLLCAALIAK